MASNLVNDSSDDDNDISLEEYYNKKSDYFKTIFSGLSQISPANQLKLRVSANGLKTSWYYFSGLQRKINNDNRSQVVDYINIKIGKYEKYYNAIINNITSSQDKYTIAGYVKAEKENIDLWIRGLDGLNAIYEGDTLHTDIITRLKNRFTDIKNKSIN